MVISHSDVSLPEGIMNEFRGSNNEGSGRMVCLLNSNIGTLRLCCACGTFGHGFAYPPLVFVKAARGRKSLPYLESGSHNIAHGWEENPLQYHPSGYIFSLSKSDVDFGESFSCRWFYPIPLLIISQRMLSYLSYKAISEIGDKPRTLGQHMFSKENLLVFLNLWLKSSHWITPPTKVSIETRSES